MHGNQGSRTRKVSQEDEEIIYDWERTNFEEHSNCHSSPGIEQQQHSRHANMSALDGGRPESAPRTKGGTKKSPHEKGHREQGNGMRALRGRSHNTGVVPFTEHDDTFGSDLSSVTRDMQKGKSLKTGKNSGKESTRKSVPKKENSDKTTDLERLLQDQPDIYKKCVLSVDERGWVYARVMDAGSAELRKIGIFNLKNRGHSFPDDEVVVEVLKKKSHESEDESTVTGDSENMPSGKVLGVLKSANNLDKWLIECTVDEGNMDILRPIDRSLPSLTSHQRQKKPGHVAVFEFRSQKDIVFRRHIPVISNASMPDIFLVRYLSWKGHDPVGVVVGILPNEISLQRSMHILRIESRNQVGFGESAQGEIENNFPQGFTLPECELSGRLDCTSMMTFTIDPPDSRDIDDALSVTDTGNGHHVIGVHIADVSYFVQFETELDKASRKRGTTVYEIGGKDPIPMLPNRLGSDLCSLQEGQKRLTLSVFMTTDENDEIIDIELKKTVICSQFRLNYFQVEAALRGTQVADAEFPSELSRVLFLLNRISKRWRRNRTGLAEFSRQTNNFDFANTPMAHRIVEEMMVTANRCVAKHLLERFPTCTPLVVQQVPDEPEIQDWRRRFPNEAAIIEMVQPFHLNSGSVNAVRDDAAAGLKKKFVLHRPIWNEMKKCLEEREFERLQSFILSPEYHPCLIVAWFNLPSFTKRASHICSGDRKPDGHRHFSLNIPHYTQFTSPIRRYLDLVVHRLVHLSVDNQVELSKYTQSKMSVLCEENQTIKTKVQNYESSVKNTHSAEFLRQRPLVIHTLVERAVATGFRLNCLKLSAYLKLWPVDVAYLGARKVKAVPQHPRGKVILIYSLRIYDLESTSVGSSVSSQEQRSPVKLSGRRHVVYTTVAAWKELVRSAIEGNPDRIASCMEEVGASLVDPAKMISSGFQGDVSCEGSELLSVVDFSLAIAAGDVIQVQVAGDFSRGKLAPFVQLLSVSPTVDVCLEHRSNTGKCFAQLTGMKNASHGEHETIEGYCNAWMSLVVAESAERSVTRNDSFILQNVGVNWLGGEEAFFQVPVEFCRRRHISVFHEILTETEEEDVGSGGCVGFMCLRYSGIRKKAPETELPIGNVVDLSDPFTWVGHCVVTGIRKIEDLYKIHFRLNQSSAEVPEQLLHERDSSKATVEWISNTQAERDTLRSLCRIRQKIVGFAATVARVPSNLPPPGRTYLALAAKHMSRIKGVFNAEQLREIGEALCLPFSMIHGYASSGKTIMAAQLAYRFSLMNRKLAGTERMQVLCCGPTEGSLQSLANCLCDESLDINVVLICSQEEEQTTFPLPGYSKNLKCQAKWCDDHAEKTKTFYLHHRVHGSSTPNGDFIRMVDSKVALNEDVVTDDLSKYLAAIEEEESGVLGSADVLLCSCATSVQKRIRCSTNITQVIIDDSQACTEPETLLPLTHQSVCQVVVFGDVKQLKPCVISSTARKYGLTRSLFERYAEELLLRVVLTEQFTMHESMQHFLATCFYDNAKPNVRRIRDDSMPSLSGFWPEDRSDKPFLFLNVVGNESQSPGGTSGCVSDISNPEEARVVAEVCKLLAKKCTTSEMDIAALSPYDAQCLEIGKHLKDCPTGSISSVNSAQGKHWSYVVLSTVRSQPVSEKPDKKRLHCALGILCAKNTCNTLLSRADNGLIIIGNKTLLECDDSWKKVIRYFEKHGSVIESVEFLSSMTN